MSDTHRHVAQQPASVNEERVDGMKPVRLHLGEPLLVALEAHYRVSGLPGRNNIEPFHVALATP